MHAHDNIDNTLVESIRVLYGEGLTLREIAVRLKMGQETIRRVMVDAGIERRSRGQPVGKHRPSGGRILDRDGYILLRAPDHPYANSSGYIREHRLVMEEELGRYLRLEEVVHHLNGDKADNRLENLELFASNSEQKQVELLGNSWARGDVGNPRRSVRVMRSPEEILKALRDLAARLDRPILRVDLQPPWPSYRAIARAFGSWQNGVALALDDEYRADWEAEQKWAGDEAA